MNLRIPVIASLLFLSACSDSVDYVTDQAPFINRQCSYGDYKELEASARSASQNHELKLKIRLTSAADGTFMILLWRKDLNISLSGIADTKGVFFTAIKRGGALATDKAFAKSVVSSLAITCIGERAGAD